MGKNFYHKLNKKQMNFFKTQVILFIALLSFRDYRKTRVGQFVLVYIYIWLKKPEKF